MSLSNERIVVSYTGAISQKIKSTFESSDYSLTQLTLKQIKANTSIRTVILYQKPLKYLLRFIHAHLKAILDNGTQIIVIESDEYSRATRFFNLLDIGKKLRLEDHDARLLPISVIHTSRKAWANHLLSQCGKHRQLIPRVSSLTQKVTIDKNVRVDLASKKLIKRAFADFPEIRISLLPKGMSSASGPWKVEAEANGRWIDYVVKLDSETNTLKEIDGVRDLCVEKMAFPHYPPVIRERCLSNATHRALVCAFVDRAVLFEDYIKVNSSKLAITSIFDGPLRVWRQNSREQLVTFGEYAAKEIFGEDDYLHAPLLAKAYADASKIDNSVLSPRRILNKFRSVGSIPIYKSMAHGDLHLRNIFVRHHSSDIVLIDFRNCGELHATADPSRLDISLAFDIPDDDRSKKLFTREVLINIFNPPLFGRPINLGTECPRAEAIEALRGHAITLCKELEYRIDVSASLLWRAAKFGSETAYTCASNIAKGL